MGFSILLTFCRCTILHNDHSNSTTPPPEIGKKTKVWMTDCRVEFWGPKSPTMSKIFRVPFCQFKPNGSCYAQICTYSRFWCARTNRKINHTDIIIKILLGEEDVVSIKINDKCWSIWFYSSRRYMKNSKWRILITN